MVNLKSQQPKFHLFYLSPLKTSLKLCFINRNNLWKRAGNQSKHLRTRNKRIIFLNFKMKYKQVQRQNCFIVVAEMITVKTAKIEVTSDSLQQKTFQTGNGSKTLCCLIEKYIKICFIYCSNFGRKIPNSEIFLLTLQKMPGGKRVGCNFYV